jgi:hypothetical protein
MRKRLSDRLGIGCFSAPFPAAVAPTIATTVPLRSAVLSMQFGGGCRG